MKKIFALCLLLSVVTYPAGAGETEGNSSPESPVGQWLIANGQGYFWKAIVLAGQSSTVGRGGMTFLVPDKDELEEEQISEILADSKSAQDFLSLHMVRVQLSAAELKKKDEISSMSGQILEIDTEDGLSVDGCMVTKSEDRGLTSFHILDSTLSPVGAEGEEEMDNDDDLDA